MVVSERPSGPVESGPLGGGMQPQRAPRGAQNVLWTDFCTLFR